MALTREDIIKDPELMKTLAQYGVRRNGETYNSKEEAVDSFLEDYRALQSNTISAAKFIGFVNDIDEEKDGEFKKNLGNLYKKVDEEVDEVFGDTTLMEKLGAIGDYAKYAIVDPINLLGFGAGKAIAATAGRGALKAMLGKAFSTKAGRMAGAGVATGLAEAPIGAGQERLVQEAEKDLGARKDIDYGEVALVGAASGVVGGGFGALGARKAPYSRTEEIERVAAENVENTVQGQAAKKESVADAFDEFVARTPQKTEEGAEEVASVSKPEDDLAALYVNVKDTATMPEDISNNYDPMGRIVSINKEDKTAVVEFLPKGAVEETVEAPAIRAADAEVTFDGSVAVTPASDTFETSTRIGARTENISLKDLKAISQKKANESRDQYIKDYNKFFDKSDPKYQKGKEALADAGIVGPNELDEAFGAKLTGDFIAQTNDAIVSAVQRRPELRGQLDTRKRITENMAYLLENLNPEDFAQTINPALARMGITPAQLAQMYRADISMKAADLAGQSKLQKAFFSKAKNSESMIQRIMASRDNLTNAQRASLKVIEKETKLEKEMAKRFNVGVDVWRSFLVTQPATTMRNILGSAARVPGETFSAQLDNWFAGTDRKLLGLSEEQMGKPLLRREITSLTRNLANPDDSIAITRLVAENFSEVDKKIFQVFDEYISTDKLGGNTKMDKFLGSLNGVSQVANTLNRLQDRAIKSAGFLSELDAQIKQGINRGDIVDSSIKSIDDVIKQGKLDLVNDEMIRKSLEFAYKLTYQTKRAGDDLVFGGGIVNKVQDTLNSNPVIKLAIPFPNFLINSLVFTTNRVGLGAIKSLKSGYSVLKNSTDAATAKNRAKKVKLDNAQKKLDEVIKGKQPNPAEISRLKAEIEELDIFFGKQMKGLTDFKRGIVETAEGASLLGIALVLRENSAGAEWYNVKDPTGQERDLRPLFPFAPFLFMADLILKAYKDEPISEEFLKEGTEAVIGVSARSGALGNLMRTGYKRVLNEEDPYSAKKFGKDVGGLFGYIVGGFATPIRPIQDLAGTIGQNRNLERSMQSNAFGVDIEVEWPRMQGFIDQAAKDIFRGTPFETGVSLPGSEEKYLGVFEETPEAISATGLETPSAPAAPIEKQLTGATVMREKTPVGEELAKLGIPEWKLIPYTEVKEYNFLFKELLGEFSTKVVEPYINSTEYLNLSPKEQKNNLNNFYRGKSLENLNSRLRLGLTVSRRPGEQKAYKNVRELVKEKIKEKFPLLDNLAKFKGNISGGDLSKYIEEFKTTPKFLDIKNRLPSRIGKTSNSISLKYIDERKNPEEAAALNEFIEEIKTLAKRRGSLSANQILNLRNLSTTGTTKNRDQLKSMNKFAEGGFVEDIDPEFVSDKTTEFSDIDPEFVQEYKVEDQMDELGLAPEGRLIPRSSNKVPLTTKDSKSVTEEEVKNLANTLTQIGVDMSPVGTYEAIKNLPQNVKDSVNEYDKGNIGKAALLMVLGTAGAIPGMPSNVIGKAVKGKPVKGKVISADEVVADDATKMYAKSIEDADRFDNVEDWQAEVKVIKKSNNVDLSVRTPELEASAKRLINKEIPREEHLRSIDKHKPVRGFDELPRQPTDKAVVFALKDDQRAEGLFQLPEEVTKKLNVKRSPLKVGDPVQGRLDIPAYLSHDTWIVTLLSPQIKNAKGNRTSIYGKAIHYAPDSKKGHVEFKAAEGLGQKIATGHNKTPYATVMGTVKDLDSERIRKKASEILNDPEWVQLSFDPRRQTSFYVRKGADGLPVHTPIASADEVIQIGPLVLAKNAVAKTKKDGTPWTDLNRGGSINRQMVALGL
jgi:hypothetical protein